MSGSTLTNGEKAKTITAFEAPEESTSFAD